MCGSEGYATASVEGRIAVEYFDPSSEAQDKKYAFKCHRQTIEDVDHVWPVNSLAFHPTYAGLSYRLPCRIQATHNLTSMFSATTPLLLRARTGPCPYGTTRSKSACASTHDTTPRSQALHSTATERSSRRASATHGTQGKTARRRRRGQVSTYAHLGRRSRCVFAS